MSSDASLVIFVIFALVMYFGPSIIAAVRDHPNGASISILNLFLGWTLLGWVVALVWSASAIDRRPADRSAKPRGGTPEPQTSKPYTGIKKDRICPHCEKPVEPHTPKCPECGATIVWRRVEGTGVLTPYASHAPKPKKPEPARSEEKVCPDCAETVKAAAKVCRFCGYRFDGAGSG